MLLTVYGRNAIRDTLGVRLRLNQFKNYFFPLKEKLINSEVLAI